MNPQPASYLTTAPWPGQDDGDAGRKRRGLAIATLCPITPIPIGYKVPSQSGRGDYVVSLGDEPFCSCPDWEKRRLDCKHIHAVRALLDPEPDERELSASIREDKPKYTQQWGSVQRHPDQREGRFYEAAGPALREHPGTAPR